MSGLPWGKFWWRAPLQRADFDRDLRQPETAACDDRAHAADIQREQSQKIAVKPVVHSIQPLLDPRQYLAGAARDLFEDGNPCFDVVSHSVGAFGQWSGAAGGFAPV